MVDDRPERGRAWLVALLILVVATGLGPPAHKKLIEFGWDEPDTAFFRRHMETMQSTPFDGCVFHANVTEHDGKPTNFAWSTWGRRAFTLEELQPAIDDLKATHFGRFSENFLRFNTTPADLDWFDDFAPILGNAKLAATLIREGHCAGILFDTESYQGKLFDYRKQRDASTRSWREYADQARRRGFEVMTAFQEGSSGVTVLLTFGHSYAWKQSSGGKIPLTDCEDGLLAPFVDGMIEATGAKARLVDAHELSYGYRNLEKFDQAAQTIRAGVLPIVDKPDAYRKAVTVGFGLWLDYDWPKYGWDEADLSRNYFTPAALEASTRKALQVADEYVWIYTEKPRWWTTNGPAEHLPAPYVESLRKARKGLAKD